MLSNTSTGCIDEFDHLMPKILIIAKSYGQPEDNEISSGMKFLSDFLYS